MTSLDFEDKAVPQSTSSTSVLFPTQGVYKNLTCPEEATSTKVIYSGSGVNSATMQADDVTANADSARNENFPSMATTPSIAQNISQPCSLPHKIIQVKSTAKSTELSL